MIMKLGAEGGATRSEASNEKIGRVYRLLRKREDRKNTVHGLPSPSLPYEGRLGALEHSSAGCGADY